MAGVPQAAGFLKALQRAFMRLHPDEFAMLEPLPPPSRQQNQSYDTGRTHSPEPEVGIGTGLPGIPDGVIGKENR
jgi:hypothetical protein